MSEINVTNEEEQFEAGRKENKKMENFTIEELPSEKDEITNDKNESSDDEILIPEHQEEGSDKHEDFTLNDTEDLNDDERMMLYEKALSFLRLKNHNHALLCFLGCLKGLKPTAKSKFTMLPQCLTHISEIYAGAEDYQRAVEFMQAAKLYYETAIIETGIQVDNFKKESVSEFQPLDLDPLLDEARRANEYERLSNSCLEQRKFQLALEYCGKATKLRQKAYGDEHPLTVKSLDLFTLIYAEMGKSQYSEAMTKYGDIIKTINEEVNNESREKNQIVEDEIEEKKSEILEEANPKVNQQIPLDEKAPIKVQQNASNISEEENVQKKRVRFSPSISLQEDEEQPVQLISSFQFVFIFFISVILAIVCTAVWCHVTDAQICPSYEYFYMNARYWYYYYFEPQEKNKGHF